MEHCQLVKQEITSVEKEIKIEEEAIPSPIALQRIGFFDKSFECSNFKRDFLIYQIIDKNLMLFQCRICQRVFSKKGDFVRHRGSQFCDK